MGKQCQVTSHHIDIDVVIVIVKICDVCIHTYISHPTTSSLDDVLEYDHTSAFFGISARSHDLECGHLSWPDGRTDGQTDRQTDV